MIILNNKNQKPMLGSKNINYIYNGDKLIYSDNLFSWIRRDKKEYNNLAQYDIEEYIYNLEPNTIYTITSTIPNVAADKTDAFAFLPGQSASSVTNGLYQNKPIDITTGADGKLIIGLRSFAQKNGYTIIIKRKGKPDPNAKMWVLVDEDPKSDSIAFKNFKNSDVIKKATKAKIILSRPLDTYALRFNDTNNKMIIEYKKNKSDTELSIPINTAQILYTTEVYHADNTLASLYLYM